MKLLCFTSLIIAISSCTSTKELMDKNYLNGKVITEESKVTKERSTTLYPITLDNINVLLGLSFDHTKNKRYLIIEVIGAHILSKVTIRIDEDVYVLNPNSTETVRTSGSMGSLNPSEYRNYSHQYYNIEKEILDDVAKAKSAYLRVDFLGSNKYVESKMLEYKNTAPLKQKIQEFQVKISKTK